MDIEKNKLREEVDALNQQVKNLLARVETLEKPPVVTPPPAPVAKRPLFGIKPKPASKPKPEPKKAA